MRKKQSKGKTNLKTKAPTGVAKHVSKSQPSINEIADLYIHEYITVSDFLNAIKSNPDSISENFEVKYAITVLQYQISNGKKLDAEDAKNILNKAGLKVFMPNPQPINKHWAFWKKRKREIFYYVTELAKKIDAIRNGKGVDRKLIEKIGKEIYGISHDDKWISEVLNQMKGQRDITRLALSIISLQLNLEYSTLRRNYFDDWTADRGNYEKFRDKYPEDAKYSFYETVLNKLPPGKIKGPPKEIKLKKVEDNPYSVIGYYMMAYSIFIKMHRIEKFPFLCNDEQRQCYFKSLKDK